jgi:hypothetical protein
MFTAVEMVGENRNLRDAVEISAVNCAETRKVLRA